MDVLTTAADAILSELEGKVLTSCVDVRPSLRDLTNKETSNRPQVAASSINALLNEKITCLDFSKLKNELKTPRKRRKNSLKYGDENQAPSPKTPKNDQNLKLVESPCTPLSNLKMLTRIASKEDYIPSKKSLFDNSESVPTTILPLRRCISETTSLLETKSQVAKPKLKRYPTSSDLDVNSLKSHSKSLAPSSEFSRRDKSLGLLCERFLEHFPIQVSCLETPRRLVIDDVAAILGTERRRVYDIVNILECLNMASRIQKNMYQWMGKQHLEITLSKLKGLAEEWGIGVHLSSPIEQSLRELKDSNTPSSLSMDKTDARKEKSIGILCQKFLMLFLTSLPPHKIQLERAIHLLLGQEGDNLEKLRTRGRRIYDIANVLVALRLIKKLPQCKSFMYIGPQVEASKCSLEGLSGQFQVKLRHSLLPPPLSLSLPSKKTHIVRDESVITPSDNNDPIIKKGRPRKLATEFCVSRARRNCLKSHTKAEDVESGSNSSSGIAKYPSLQEVCQIAEMEREKLLKPPISTNSTLAHNSIAASSKSLLFSHTGSPRMALTFQNPANQRSPPPLTGSPAIPSRNVSRVVVRPPFILQKLGVSRPLASQDPNGKLRPIVIKTRFTASATASQAKSSSTDAPGFRVYSRKCKDSRTLSVPSLLKSGEITPLNGSIKLLNKTSSSTVLTNSMSHTALPNISLNTLSRNHYKTIIGSSSLPRTCSFSAPRELSYRVLINTKNSDLSTGQLSSSGEEVKKENSLRPTAFVKMSQTATFLEDNNTDSELESIFGDSFKFTRPKTLIHKI